MQVVTVIAGSLTICSLHCTHAHDGNERIDPLPNGRAVDVLVARNVLAAVLYLSEGTVPQQDERSHFDGCMCHSLPAPLHTATLASVEE